MTRLRAVRQEMHQRRISTKDFVNYDKQVITCYVACSLVQGQGGKKEKEKYSWHVRRSVINGKYTGMRLVQKRYLN